jgi:hypothetical protein
MSSATVSSGHVHQLDEILKELDGVCCDLEGEELQQLSAQTTEDVMKLRNVLKRRQVEQVSGLVQTKQWDKATEKLKQNFPLGELGPVQEILVLVSNKPDGVASAVQWAGRLDVPLKRQAYEALYEQILLKDFFDQPEVMLALWKNINKLPVAILDGVRNHLRDDRSKIIERIVEGIKKKDYSLVANDES